MSGGVPHPSIFFRARTGFLWSADSFLNANHGVPHIPPDVGPPYDLRREERHNPYLCSSGEATALYPAGI
jgi:hypothetical protein